MSIYMDPKHVLGLFKNPKVDPLFLIRPGALGLGLWRSAHPSLEPRQGEPTQTKKA